MANTYSQLNIHCVFAVNGRENVITKNFRDDLHRYMSGILKGDGSFPLAMNGWMDHVHAFFELPVTMSVSDQMRMLKATSSKWINDNKFIKGKFSWQEGYGHFLIHALNEIQSCNISSSKRSIIRTKHLRKNI